MGGSESKDSHAPTKLKDSDNKGVSFHNEIKTYFVEIGEKGKQNMEVTIVIVIVVVLLIYFLHKQRSKAKKERELSARKQAMILNAISA